MTARTVALRALARIEDTGGYANLVLASELARCDLEARDRAFVTALVDGTTRMRRACDHLVDRFVQRDLDTSVRRVLRLGAFQLVFMGMPPHAAVNETVAEAPKRVRGLVNAVLRRVGEHRLDPNDPAAWPDEATRLSYPDWILHRLQAEMGSAAAVAALTAMNEPAPPHFRDDGYVQDDASRAVTDLVAARPGELIVDVCASPGGKATAMAGSGARVVAIDHTANRAGLITGNARLTDTGDRLRVVVADARSVPLRPYSADAVLVDAPCSGLGSLRRRADARWRITAADVDRLAELQVEFVTAAAGIVRPGGRLVYSVCTLTDAESTGVDGRFAVAHPEFTAEQLGEPWTPLGRGGRLAPTTDGRDGMSAFCYRRPTGS